MTEESTQCFVCHEVLEPHHEIGKAQCPHTFHVVCIHIWLKRHNHCPECRSSISLTKTQPWAAMFSAALLFNQQIAIERVTHSYTFLRSMLRRFHTKKLWKQALETIQVASEKQECAGVHLPYLNVRTRSSAKKEKMRQAQMYQDLTGEEPRNAERINTAEEQIVEQLSFLFLDSVEV